MTGQRANVDVTLGTAEYRQLVDQLPHVILLVADRNMRYVLAGGQALARAGWRADEFLGHTPSEIMPPERGALIERHMADALRGESSIVPLLPSTRADTLWEAWFGPLRARDGAVTGVIYLLRDVTQLQRLRQQARKTEELFRSTVDVLLSGFAVLSAVRDGAGRITDLRVEYANPAACTLFQLPLEEALGKRLLSLLPSMPARGTFQKLVHTVETGEPTEYEVQLAEDGSAGDALAGAFEIRAARLGDGIVITFHDVSARVSAEERLRSSEERYRVTLDSAAAGVANVALDGRFLAVNRRYCEITGYSEQELLARTYMDITHPDDLDSDVAQARRLAAGEIPWYAIEKRYIRKDGSVVWVLLTGGAFRDREGKICEYVATVTDITAQKHAQQEVARLNAELEERVRQRTAELEAFTYTVTHDLRAPLTSISGFTELLAEEYADQPGSPGTEYAARISAAAGRMRHLIEDLLTLSAASRAEIHPAVVDLSALARAAVAALRQAEPARSVEVAVEDGVRVVGDERQLGTVMENLIGNAWKFTARTPRAAIRFGAEPAADGTVHCLVSDNGAGFDPADSGKLFRPFSRLHPAEEFPGTGVGLASVQRIIERHHGRCWAEGRPGKGAVLHFTLPAPPAPAAAGA
ncbi:MAG: PAS domain S-box protein [Gemmatimonadota bacterium]